MVGANGDGTDVGGSGSWRRWGEDGGRDGLRGSVFLACHVELVAIGIRGRGEDVRVTVAVPQAEGVEERRGAGCDDSETRRVAMELVSFS